MKIKTKFFSIIVTTVLALCLAMPCCFADIQSTKDNTDVLKPKTNVEKKTEAKNVFGKFLTSMLWVGGSCFVIFFLLFAYKRLKNAPVINPLQTEIEKNLNTPDTVEEATKFVIEKF